jgi:hypothetical protein
MESVKQVEQLKFRWKTQYFKNVYCAKKYDGTPKAGWLLNLRCCYDVKKKKFIMHDILSIKWEHQHAGGVSSRIVVGITAKADGRKIRTQHKRQKDMEFLKTVDKVTRMCSKK